MSTKDISDLSGSEIIDLRDVTERVEELRDEIEDGDPTLRAEFRAELADLESLLEELCGNGGDHQWEGDWYPGFMIRRSYFEEYARDLANDLGAITGDAGWPQRHIDWKAAARELEQDYSEVDFGGTSWLYR